MLKKLLAGLTAIALSLGMVALTAGPASAHQGNITASAVCDPQTGDYDVTYKLSWASVPSGVHGDMYTRTGTTSFENGWSYPGGKTWTDRGDTVGESGFITWTETLSGDTTGNGPWVYAYIEWSNGNTGSRYHDTRIEGLAGDCGDTVKKVDICHWDNGKNQYELQNVSYNAIVTGAGGHQKHGNDIIPPFTYSGGSYPGKNWDASTSPTFIANGCANPKVTPVKFTVQEKLCVDGSPGVPSTYGTVTISATNPTKVAYSYVIKANSSTPSAGEYLAATPGQVIDVPVGSTIWVKATGINGYELQNYTGPWSEKIDSATYANCDVDVDKPGKPTSSTAVCTAAGQSSASVTIPSGVTGYQYAYRYGSSGGWTNVAQGTVLDDVAFGTTVQVRATLIFGYTYGGSWGNGWTKINGDDDDRYYELTITGQNSVKCIVPGAPTPDQANCVANGPGIEGAQVYVPLNANVQYKIDGVSKAGGQWYPVTGLPKSITVTATAINGYAFPAGTTISWPLSFADTGDCLDDAPSVEPDWTDAYCYAQTTGTSPASYIVYGTPGDHVSYWVSTTGENGTYTELLSNGPHPATVGTTVWIKAVPDAGYQLKDYTGPWSHNFTDPGDCLDDGVPVDPTFVDGSCVEPGTGVNDGYYIVNAGTNVSFEVRINGGSWTPVDSATYGVKVYVTPGDKVEITAVPDSGYKLTGDEQGPWGHTFTDPGECLDEVTPGDVTFTPQVCAINHPGVPGQAGYTLPVIPTGVVYTVTINSVDSTGTAGFHPLNLGDTVSVVATAASGYKLAAGTWAWGTWTVTSPTDPNAKCLYPAPIDPIAAVDQVCVVDDLDTGDYHNQSGYITIPSTPHVKYFIDGVYASTGDHEYVPGVYEISAEADAGYELTGVPDPWTVEIEKALPCGLQTFPGVVPTVSFAQTTCSASGSYTLTVDPGELAEGVVWTVSGGLPNTVGTHAVNAAGTVTITAVPAPGYGFDDGIEGPAIREWSFDFTTLPDDCLPTLAFTGSSIATGGLGLAGLLTLGGVLMIVAHRRRAALIEE